jgi:hypothetical protein
MALQPSVGPWPFFSFLILYTVGRTPWTGDRPVARPLPTHRTTQTQNKRTQYRHLCLEWDSIPRSQCWSERRQFMPSTARPLWSALFTITTVNIQACTKPIRPTTTFIAHLNNADILPKPVISMSLWFKTDNMQIDDCSRGTRRTHANVECCKFVFRKFQYILTQIRGLTLYQSRNCTAARCTCVTIRGREGNSMRSGRNGSQDTILNPAAQLLRHSTKYEYV